MTHNSVRKKEIVLALLALIALIPYDKLPKVLQDLKNILESVNPLKRLWDMITSMSLEEAKEKLQKGDHIYAYRSFYSHHGIYAGDGKVWEYDGTGDDAQIRLSSLEYFAKGEPINKLNYSADFTPEQILARASTRLYEKEYDVVNNNCLHYALWCRLASKEGIEITQRAFQLLPEVAEA